MIPRNHKYLYDKPDRRRLKYIGIVIFLFGIAVQGAYLIWHEDIPVVLTQVMQWVTIACTIIAIIIWTIMVYRVYTELWKN